ncbi:SapC [Novipirellula aureliae]|uniref:SapC n=1 Tax=Novipirellula aureliae TaxID=2527966 RepID=A0A5C6DYH5_9BACT|nr:SapC family protein [Novipirellula aureliae]TWU41274.1 SapC [Novipirellula aureliae]
MTKQQMIYDQVVPVSKERHGSLGVDTSFGYEFARGVRTVPIVAAEIPQAAREYAVVFAPTGNGNDVAPMAILSVREGEDLHLSNDGEWTARYIPAFLRRYPFVFANAGTANNFTLCIDESWGGCNRDGSGENLFDENGERTEFLNQLVQFNQDFQRSSQMTELFCSQLRELDLLDAKQAKLTSPEGTETRLTGFFIVDREKLKTLPGDKLEKLSRNGMLELLYAHLLSLHNLGVSTKSTQNLVTANS